MSACLFGVAFICLTLLYPCCVCVPVCLFVCLACLAVWLSLACCPLASALCPPVSDLILHINFYLFIYLICFLRAFFFIDVSSSSSSCTCFSTGICAICNILICICELANTHTHRHTHLHSPWKKHLRLRFTLFSCSNFSSCLYPLLFGKKGIMTLCQPHMCVTGRRRRGRSYKLYIFFNSINRGDFHSWAYQICCQYML